MKDEKKTKDRLVKELAEARRLIATMEKLAIERMPAEEVLRERQARLDSIFRASPIGIGVVAERILLEVNDSICEMTGYVREELIGKSARILYPTQGDFDFVGSEKYRQIQEKGTGFVETCWRQRTARLLILSSHPLLL